MSLQFVAGPSGCGKSYYVYQYVIQEAIRNPNERFLIVVPEQFSMQTQKELVELHPAHALLNIDVLSFNRLAYRVFAELGENRAPILEDTGKILVLQKLISENRDALQVLSQMVGKNGAAARVNSQLSEFMQYRVDLDALSAMEMPELLKRKLSDLKVLADAFAGFLQGRYLTAEEVPEALSRVIERYRPLVGATVVLDGFTGFVPTQYLVLKKLLGMCKKVLVCALSDRSAGLHTASGMSELFHMTHRMAERLTELAKEVRTEILPDIWVDPSEKSRFAKNEVLSFLEKSLFRYQSACWQKPQESVFLRECGTYEEEIQFAAQMIARLVRTQRYRYRDFAFVSGSLEDYGEAAQRIFRENGIPCFLDQKNGVRSNPAAVFVRAAVSAAADDFSAKSVFRLLKTGMGGLTEEEVSLMENYVLAFRIRGRKAYGKTWERHSKTIPEEELPRLNEIRARFIGQYTAFADAFRKNGSTVRERTTALYRLIEQQEIQQKCRLLEKKYEAQQESGKAREYAQIYKRIMDFLEKLVEILGEDRISLELYLQLIEAGFAEMKLGLIPPQQDSVVIGDIERTRLKNIRVMFFAGLNDGIVPKNTERTSVLSEYDRRMLQKMQIDLAPDARAEMFRQRLYLYMALTRPSERLYLSWSRAGAAGEALQPSYLVEAAAKLFPQAQMAEEAGFLQMETLSGRQQLLAEGFQSIREEKPKDDFLELVSFERKQKETDRLIEKMCRAAQTHCPDTRIGRAAAAQLYGRERKYSVSRLEEHGNCGFRHFLEYGLTLEKREIYSFSPADIGTILHEAIRLFGAAMQKEGWQADEETVFKLADQTFFAAYENQYNPSGTQAFDRRKLLGIHRMTALSVCEQIRRGAFYPLAFEEKFLVEGVSGVIDRMDVCTEGDVRYLRIIDYKSSQNKANLTALFYGTQLQLPLYLTAACELAEKRGKGVVQPAGIYYYAMDDPFIEVASLLEDVTAEKHLKKLKLRGISRKEPEILMLMDKNLAPGVTSDILPIHFNTKTDSDGSPVPDKNTRVLSGEDFGCLGRYTRQLIQKMRSEIENGDVRIDPKQIGDADSCSYCPYRAVCRFDERVDGYKKKVRKEKKDEEVLQDMYQELKEGK